MTIQWNELVDRFREKLETMEKGALDGSSAIWRLGCLEQALELLEENPDAAAKHLDDFERPASIQEISDLADKFDHQPTVEDIRTRFDNLGGGIV